MEDVSKTGDITEPGIELGKWMGRREAFGLIAGRCSAAEVESLRRIHDDRLYEGLHCTWDEFCARNLGVAPRTVERDLANLRRFGPAFFTLRQLTRVSVREYQAIAPQVSEDGVRVNGAVVALLPENSEALAGAVKTLLEGKAPAAAPEARPDFDAALRRFRSAIQGLRAFAGDLDTSQMRSLARELSDALSAADACGVSLKAR